MVISTKQASCNTRYKQAGHLARFENSLYLTHLFLTERLRIFNPSLRVARERYAGVAEITQTNPIWKSRLVIARKSEIGSEKLEAKTESNITLTKN